MDVLAAQVLVGADVVETFTPAGGVVVGDDDPTPLGGGAVGGPRMPSAE